jgi:hypothetical protein
VSELKINTCNRCDYKWVGKIKTPNTCANSKCRTPYWNKPRIRKQTKRRQNSVEKFSFYFETTMPDKTYSFVITENEITCDECNSKRCNHIFEILSNSKIRQKIIQRGIIFSPKYEDEVKELSKNTYAFVEFVENEV